MAASNSSGEDKAAADYVCDGTDDQDTIQTALDLLTEDGTLTLFDGTYVLGGTVVEQCTKTVNGSGVATILDGTALGESQPLVRMDGECTLTNLKMIGGGGGVEMFDGGSVSDLWFDGTAYGVDCKNNCTVTNINAANIADANGWAAIVHAAGVHDITIANITGLDCDRGIEIENGSYNIAVDTVELTNIYQADSYTFTCDVHSHAGGGVVHDVAYTNLTLNNCSGLTANNSSGADRVQDITFNHVTFNGFQYQVGTRALHVVNGDRVEFLDVTMIDVPEAQRTYEYNSTDVVFDIN